MPAFAEADAAVRADLGRRYSAAVLRVESAGRLRFSRAYGTTTRRSEAPAIYPDSRFDIASLTKIFVSTLALALVASRQLALDTDLTSVLPEWRCSAHAAITLRMLLAHTAGLRSGADYRTLLDRDVESFSLSLPLVDAPGRAVVYSDLGFIVLGIVVARTAGLGLARIVERTIGAYGARGTAYSPHPAERPSVPATEHAAWRGLVQGVVHDEKAYLLNGIAGHAGLFADAADVARSGEWYLAAHHRRPTPLDRGLARLAVTPAADDPVLRRGLGWALKTGSGNSCGDAMGAATFGHTGFTGTSIWVDPERDLNVVLLTNAVHFGRDDLRPVRAAVCDAAVAAVDA